MDFSQIKLVVSDMDGTLLNSKGNVSNKFFSLFEKLQEKNIHFCAASGRQHNSIISKLATIQDQIYVIAENGGVVKQGETTLLSQFLDVQKVQEIIPILRTIAGANMVLCCDNSAYIESKDERFINLFQEYYHSFQQVEDVMEIAKTIPVFKIAVYHFDSSEKFIFPVVQDFKNDVLLKISGQHWLDISDEKANKGNALKEVQKILNVTKQETLVFGDYHNDIEMMQESNFSFAMKNAHEDIKKIAKYITESNNNFGVEMVLEKLVNQSK
jgi:Cof subfamily protein (haloacid dehalogenase superfamily)